MRGSRFIRVTLPLLSLLCASTSHAQAGASTVYWHIDPGVKTCSMVIDPSLTQAQWATFARQTGAIASFKSLAPAEPLGKLNFTLGFDYSSTPVDQRDPAWINTFTHPDADCPLGDRIELPTVRARVGVSSMMDVGAFWTTAPRANYGMLGGEAKYAFLTESARVPAAAVTASFATLTGVPDFNFSVYSVGVLASKRVAGVTPYLGLREGVVIATETTDKVDLDRETPWFAQGFLGAQYSIWRLGLAAEYNIADVNTFVVVMGFNPWARGGPSPRTTR